MAEENKSYYLPFPTRLRQLMDGTGASQQALADYVGVTRQAVAQWKDGKTIPDMYNFKRIAEFFKIPYEYLLGDTDSKVHENMALADSLGLSDDAIETLEGIKEFSQHDDEAGYISTPEVISRIICNGYFDEFLKLIQASIVDYRKFQEYTQHEGFEDVVGIERDEAKKYSSFGKTVIPMNEMSVFHLYRARELMMKILEDIPQDKYEESIGIR
jgi:transcriptional regulator with XRE-family HTH domain